MTTIKMKMRPPAHDSAEGTLRFQVTHECSTCQIDTGLRLYPHEWDALRSGIVITGETPRDRRDYLLGLKSRIAHDAARLNEILIRLKQVGKPFTCRTIVEKYLEPSSSEGIIAFAERIIAELRGVGKERTAETYTCALNSFKRFRNGCDIPLDETDSRLMMAYESYLHHTGVCPNSSSFYMRNLRAVYNRAVERELTVQRFPFKHVYTGIDKTVKRAVPLNVIRKIRATDLRQKPRTEYARDLFMFSFYTRGMSFVDMAFLKRSDLRNGVLSYRRRKTGQQLFIKWEKPMQDIIDKYGGNDTPYLLPIIKEKNADTWRQYKNAAHLVNDKLKKLGIELGLPDPLTTYVARHTWASIAKSKNIPIETISEAMGHDSEKTTRIYLASLDTSGVDKANSLILKILR